ncbi:hypothetical protein [Brevundimonas sp.]|uniref:hypothetical protein n=1 Tax=Brevundimonas sp. TaxID=1871086 RepID=UPI001DF52185|nr:hypothetical protein [Brevundimonas sp.]MBA4000427.1 hypothetical protein [Brevundimonas sp.]
MRGEILTFDAATRMVAIRGDDGNRYLFPATAVHSGLTPRRGQRVDFTPTENGQPGEIFILQSGESGAVSTQGGFDLGRVISRTFASIRDNWLLLLVASLVLVGLPSTLAAVGQTLVWSQESTTAGFLFVTLGTLLYFIGFYMLQGTAVKAVVNGFNGKKTDLGVALDVGVRMFFPLLGLGILAGLGMALGFILLIVPGVILAVLWSVAAPAIVIEKRGVFDSFQRSRDLTRGYRWNVFGLLVIYILLAWILEAAIGAVSFATGGAFAGGDGPNLWINILGGPVVNVLSAVIATAGVASLYYELRTVKEGAGPESLASVFD